MYSCDYYVGITCINGNCPNADNPFPEFDCDGCPYNDGCKDCAGFDLPFASAPPELCPHYIKVNEYE